MRRLLTENSHYEKNTNTNDHHDNRRINGNKNNLNGLVVATVVTAITTIATLND